MVFFKVNRSTFSTSKSFVKSVGSTENKVMRDQMIQLLKFIPENKNRFVNAKITKSIEFILSRRRVIISQPLFIFTKM